jgi:hypothetical protein
MTRQEESYRNSLYDTLRRLEDRSSDFVYVPGKDFTRKRKLLFSDTMKAVVIMEGNSLNKELCDIFNFNANGKFITKSAFVQSRDKIKPEAFGEAFRMFNAKTACNDLSLFEGYRLLAIDGSDINIALNENSTTYFPPNNRSEKGFNQFHINALFDILNNTYTDCVIQDAPKEHEIEAARQMIKRLGNRSAKELIVADRGYASLDLLETIRDVGADFLFRVPEDFIRETRNLPEQDCDVDVTFTIYTSQTKESKKLMAEGKAKYLSGPSKFGKPKKTVTWYHPSPYLMSLRIVRFKLSNGNYEIICTSLKRDKFPPEKLKTLYHLRWGIETSFRYLKYAIGLINFHAKKETSVKQEIFARLLMYNFCSRVASSVVVEDKDTRNLKYKTNFTEAIHICFAYLKRRLTLDIRKLIAQYIEPVRPGREDERKLKIKSFTPFLYRVA